MVRPHVVSTGQLPEDFKKGLLDSYPGAGQVDLPIDPENWQIITDGMYQVTQPGLYHTAGGEYLEGIDFGGKTGTAQVMSHQALDKSNKAKSTNPNVWFVGVTPSRNPELVVAVLWQNGNKSWFAARIGAKVVSAYVEKQRRLANNLVQPKVVPPAEMSAVWTAPTAGSGPAAAKSGVLPVGLESGRFLVKNGDIVAPGKTQAHAAGIQPRPIAAVMPAAAKGN